MARPSAEPSIRSIWSPPAQIDRFLDGADHGLVIVTGYIKPIGFRDLRLGTMIKAADGPCDWRVERMTQLELIGFAAAVVDGRIFVGEYVKPAEDMAYVFPAAAFLLECTAEARKEIGTFYEFRSQAVGTTHSGQPSFATVQLVHREDWLRAKDLIAAEMIRRERARS